MLYQPERLSSTVDETPDTPFIDNSALVPSSALNMTACMTVVTCSGHSVEHDLESERTDSQLSASFSDISQTAGGAPAPPLPRPAVRDLLHYPTVPSPTAPSPTAPRHPTPEQSTKCEVTNYRYSRDCRRATRVTCSDSRRDDRDHPSSCLHTELKF
jgi:hypothetical protein